MKVLENYSSPMQDAKRLSKFMKPSKTNTSSYRDLNCSYHRKHSFKTQELHVPTIASVLKYKERARLMNASNTARKILAASGSGGHCSSVQKTSEMGSPNSTLNQFNLISSKSFLENTNKNIGLNVESNIDSVELAKKRKLYPVCDFTFSNPIKVDITFDSKSVLDLEHPKNMSNLYFNSENDAPQIKKQRISTFVSSSLDLAGNNSIEPLMPSKVDVSVNTDIEVSTKIDKSFQTSLKELIDKSTQTVEISIYENKSSTWKCDSCGTKNHNDSKNCSHCHEEKLKVTLPTINLQENKTKTDSNIKLNGNTMIPLSSMSNINKTDWKCDICWIKNKENIEKCVACGASKPLSAPGIQNSSKSLSSQIIQSTWKCPHCLISNDSNRSTCQCCEVEKFSENNKSDKKTFNFGMNYKFGIEPSTANSESNKGKLELISDLPVNNTSERVSVDIKQKDIECNKPNNVNSPGNHFNLSSQQPFSFNVTAERKPEVSMPINKNEESINLKPVSVISDHKLVLNKSGNPTPDSNNNKENEKESLSPEKSNNEQTLTNNAPNFSFTPTSFSFIKSNEKQESDINASKIETNKKINLESDSFGSVGVTTANPLQGFSSQTTNKEPTKFIFGQNMNSPVKSDLQKNTELNTLPLFQNSDTKNTVKNTIAPMFNFENKNQQKEEVKPAFNFSFKNENNTDSVTKATNESASNKALFSNSTPFGFVQNGVKPFVNDISSNNNVPSNTLFGTKNTVPNLFENNKTMVQSSNNPIAETSLNQTTNSVPLFGATQKPSTFAENTMNSFPPNTSGDAPKPAVFTFGSAPFNSSTSTPLFGNTNPTSNNIFGVQSSAQPFMFSAPPQNKNSQGLFSPPQMARPASNNNMFGNVGSEVTSPFGTNNQANMTFGKTLPSTGFNFTAGTTQANGMFTFGQQQSQQPGIQTGVFNFGANSGGLPQVQFNIGTSNTSNANISNRRIKRAVRRTPR